MFIELVRSDLKYYLCTEVQPQIMKELMKGVTDSWKNELDLAYFNAKINHIFYCLITLILGLEFKAFHLKIALNSK